MGYILSSNVGLSGIFDTSVNSASTNTKESSVMNFLSTVESRTAQAASSGTTLLPQFRAPSWQTGDFFFFFSKWFSLIKIHYVWLCHYGSVAESEVNY